MAAAEWTVGRAAPRGSEGSGFAHTTIGLDGPDPYGHHGRQLAQRAPLPACRRGTSHGRHVEMICTVRLSAQYPSLGTL